MCVVFVDLCRVQCDIQIHVLKIAVDALLHLKLKSSLGLVKGSGQLSRIYGHFH